MVETDTQVVEFPVEGCFNLTVKRTLRRVVSWILVSRAILLFASPMLCPAAQAAELSASVVSINGGTVAINGVDTARPTVPFTFNWGDGATTTGFFPQQHVYADTTRNYGLIITAHHSNGAEPQASVAIPFTQQAGIALTAMDAVAADTSGVSVPLSGNAAIRFVNSYSYAVELYWIDYSGNRAFYGTIPASSSLRQPTFVGTLWLLARAGTGATTTQGTGTLLGAFAAVTNIGSATSGLFDTATVGSGSGVSPTYAVATSMSGTGSGSVTVNNPQSSYAAGTVVTVTATANSGSVFAGWSGDCSGLAATCTLVMDGSKNVTATFNLQAATMTYGLTTGTLGPGPGTGSGTVTLDPPGPSYAAGTTVTLTATANSGSVFAGWTGACAGATAVCRLTMDANKTTVAIFNLSPSTNSYSLTTTTTGTGSGTIASDRTGSSFASGTVVTLTATAENGSTFARWSGACSGTAATCQVTMDSAKSVTAIFNLQAAPSSALRVGAVFSTAQAGAQSFLRFYNSGSSAGTVTVTLSDNVTGAPLGRWTSPSIPAGAAAQYFIGTLEGVLRAGVTKPSYYSIAVETGISGFFQHVLYRPSDGTLTNLSTCSAGVTANKGTLNNVHSSLLGAGFPSSVVVNNTGASNASAALGIYDARDGTKVGTYTTPTIPVGGQAVATVASIETTIGQPPANGVYHYVIKTEDPFTGFLQHLVTNTQAGVITDMTTVCVLNGTASTAAAARLRLGAVFSTAQPASQSFLRFYNTGSSAGTATVTLLNDATGASLGQWTTPSIPAGAATQYSIGTIEGTLSSAVTKPGTYSIAVDSGVTGYFQHVLYRPSDGTLTNLSTCGAGVTTNTSKLNSVHSSLLGTGFPSSVVVNNTGESSTPVALGVYDARDGAKIGTYTTAAIPAGGQVNLTVTAIENALGKPPASGMFHYIIKTEGAFTGFLQHLVTNTKAGVITDMTTVCALPVSAVRIASVSTSSPMAMTPLYVSTAGLDMAKPVTVTLTNPTGASVTLAPIRTQSDGTVVVAMPVYIDPTTGKTNSLAASLAISQESLASAPVNINIQDIPQLSAYGTALGQISRAFHNYQAIALGRSLNSVQAIQATPASTIDNKAVQANLQTQLIDIILARRDIDRVMTDSSTQIPAGSLSNGAVINFDRDALEIEDRVIGMYLTRLASVFAGVGTASASQSSGNTGSLIERPTATSAGDIIKLIGAYNNILKIEANKDILFAENAELGDQAAAAAAVGPATLKLATLPFNLNPEAKLYVNAVGIAAGSLVIANDLIQYSFANNDLQMLTAHPELVPDKIYIRDKALANAKLNGLKLAFDIMSAGADIGIVPLGTSELFIKGTAANAKLFLDMQKWISDAALKDIESSQAATRSQTIFARYAKGEGKVVSVDNIQDPELRELLGLSLKDPNTGNTFSAIPDLKGSYELVIPLDNPAMDYGKFALSTFDPVTGAVSSSQTVDLRDAKQTATFGLPTITIGAPTTSTRTLTTATAGTGSGSIVANPNTLTHALGSRVTLTATPATGSVFANWTGECAGTAPVCELTMSEDKSVGAVFNKIVSQSYTLTVVVTGSSETTVTPTTGSYAPGTKVVLTASHTSDWELAFWSESGCPASSRTCEVTMNSDKTVYATFRLLPKGRLTVSASPPNGGSISPSGGLFSYGSNGTSVQLTATPAAGFTFGSWSSNCVPTSGPQCTVAINGSTTTVTANFVPIQQTTYTLTATRTPTAGGTVSLDPSGPNYGSGTVVTATATAAAGYTFTGWSGACSGTGACKVTMTSHQLLNAAFSVTPSSVTPSPVPAGAEVWVGTLTGQSRLQCNFGRVGGGGSPSGDVTETVEVTLIVPAPGLFAVFGPQTRPFYTLEGITGTWRAFETLLNQTEANLVTGRIDCPIPANSATGVVQIVRRSFADRTFADIGGIELFSDGTNMLPRNNGSPRDHTDTVNTFLRLDTVSEALITGTWGPGTITQSVFTLRKQ